MYYHVYIEAKSPSRPRTEVRKVDCEDKNDIIKNICIPYLLNKRFNCKGTVLIPDEVQTLYIVQSEISSENWYNIEGQNSSLKLFGPDGIIKSKKSVDVTNEFMDIASKIISNGTDKDNGIMKYDTKKVFIVHGHDNELISQVALFLSNAGLDPIILSEQASKGNTIIEKIEKYSNVNFAIVLYTPCDKGTEVALEDYKFRARQNVIFEHGFLIAKLGRENVIALIKGNIEIPSDISGLVYTPVDESGAWKIKVAKEIKEAGLEINIDNIINKF